MKPRVIETLSTYETKSKYNQNQNPKVLVLIKVSFFFGNKK